MNSDKKVLVVPVILIKKVTSDIFQITFYSPEITKKVKSGHFINIQVPNVQGILWRRPIGVFNVNIENETFDILFKAVGKGTQALSKIKISEKLDIIGPLGNHFEYPADIQHAIMVAGGLGIAPFPLMLQDTKKLDIKYSLFYGVKSKSDFAGLELFDPEKIDLHLSTDDGSKGDKGFITQSLIKYLETFTSTQGVYMYVCGPTPLLAKVKEIAEKFNIHAQVSVETLMACGFGACMGCPVPLEKPLENGQKYLLACKDGPVFNMKDIILND